MAKWNSDTNNNAFAALLSGKKAIEIRANNPHDPVDYSKVEVGDEILFTKWPVPDAQRLSARVVRVNHYQTAEELYAAEGINLTSSSHSHSVDEAVRKLYKHTGYKEAIQASGVYAIELASIHLIDDPPADE